MKRPPARSWWLLLALVPLALGIARLRFDADVLSLLPAHVPAVTGLKLYQKHFTNARELILTVSAPRRDLAASAAQAIADRLRAETNLISEVVWQPPWLEHPEQTAELIAYLWFNQPPEVFDALAHRLATTNLNSILSATRDELSTTLSPTEIARLSYDPFGLTRLPEQVAGAAPGFAEGEEMFASPDGTFRILFIRSRHDLAGYRECSAWFEAVKRSVTAAAPSPEISLGYTGRPVFVAEISGSMKRDITLSVGGTALIIAVLFWFAHRRWKPMLWLLTLLALVLAGTLALGGLLFGTLNVISLGFAAILLGLAVDYAVVHYQEALAHPDLSVPEIRRAIAPSIFWAAITTITAFLVLNFGGLPGLAQLGSLVALGVALSALVMIFAFLPPLFPERMKPSATRGLSTSDPKHSSTSSAAHEAPSSLSRARIGVVLAVSLALLLFCGVVLVSGFPKMDASADALQPRDSQAYATLHAIQEHLAQQREPLWLIVAGRSESEVARRLEAVEPVLHEAKSNQTLAGFTVPAQLWPRPEHQTANRATAHALVATRGALHTAALSGGFAEEALGLTDRLLDAWQQAAASSQVYWPTNPLCTWIFEKLVAREPGRFLAVGFLYPATNSIAVSSLTQLEARLPREGVWLSSWELLGGTVLATVKQNLWKLVLPMAALVLLSLWLAFRRLAEITLSLVTLLISGLVLLAVMKLMGWSWNVLNLMAAPLILGTGVDYSLFMQLALRRHQGDLRVAYRSVGRALLLCGGTAVTGFGTLGLSSNAGMASLGQVCAIGIAANMLISVFLLPVWWRWLAGASIANPATGAPPASPSSLYGATGWRVGLAVVSLMPSFVCSLLARLGSRLYWHTAPHRREVVIANLLPVFKGDRIAAKQAARDLFREFALKIADLWRFESGLPVNHWLADWRGWELFHAAHARGQGVLLVTPHLGNWELGGAFLATRGLRLLVLTQPEPQAELTELRRAARSRLGIETLVVGNDSFAFVEIIKRLQAGAIVAMLVDRPVPATAVRVELFGQPFDASIAAAELARASGCAIVPAIVVRNKTGYTADVFSEIPYDRAAIGNRDARIRLTQQILHAFEPAIRQHPDQWYHFVPVWPEK